MLKNERKNEIEIDDQPIKEIDICLHKVCKSICKIQCKNWTGT